MLWWKMKTRLSWIENGDGCGGDHGGDDDAVVADDGDDDVGDDGDDI